MPLGKLSTSAFVSPATFITFDAASDGASGFGATSKSWAHTCSSNANRILFLAGTSGGTGTGVAASYNGVPMTLVVSKEVPSLTNWVYLFMLVNPPSGSHTVLITSTTTQLLAGCTASYAGARQTGQPDASASASVNGSTSLALALTTVTNNAWAAMCQYGMSTAPGGVILRAFNSACGLYDSGGLITPAGAYSETFTDATSVQAAGVVASFAPV